MWDATKIVEWTRKHTGNTQDGLATIGEIIAALVQKRDQRKDGFVSVIRTTMRTRLGDNAEECQKVLGREGIPRSAAKEAVEYAQQHGGFSIWSLVDAGAGPSDTCIRTLASNS